MALEIGGAKGLSFAPPILFFRIHGLLSIYRETQQHIQSFSTKWTSTVGWTCRLENLNIESYFFGNQLIFIGNI